MGCRYCTSGLGLLCNGPNGLDDLEAACTCECHAENQHIDDQDAVDFEIICPDDWSSMILEQQVRTSFV